MTEDGERRRPAWTHVLVALLAVFVLALSCSDNAGVGPDEEEEVEEDFGFGAQVLGVCFMGEDNCVSSYVDLGEYTHSSLGKVTSGIPAYIFPSLQGFEGGLRHPFDSTGLYLPFRLQNNVFADHGRVWEMFAVYSADLNLVARPLPGVVLWGVGADTTLGDPNDIKSYIGRDLYANPITSEEEIVELELRGDVKVVRMGMLVDCPMVAADDDDTVVNLNPTYSLCVHSIER